MHPRLLTSLFLLACAGPLPAAQVQAHDEPIAWLDNYQQAIRQARQIRKPVFLEFRCEA